MKFVVAIFLLTPLLVLAQDRRPEGNEQLVWEYAEFVQAFREKNWTDVCEFVSEHTKASFGGDEGCAGVRRVYAGDDQCWDEMVFALRQGCRKTSVNGDLACVSPPQWADEDVAYLGARAGFVFNPERKKWMAEYLVCGGD